MGWDHATVDGLAGDEAELHAAVKAGVLGFSKSFARAVAPEVRVNVLCPGWIETAFGEGADRAFHAEIARATPLQRWGTPADVAGAAVWLASPGAGVRHRSGDQRQRGHAWLTRCSSPAGWLSRHCAGSSPSSGSIIRSR